MGLFDVFKNKDEEKTKSNQENISLFSPINGELQKITDVPDPVFSQEVMGKGFAINPTNGYLYAPFSGVIKQVAETKHAVTLESENGAQVLIHIGVDTVNLKGQGFKTQVKTEQKIKSGDLLVEFDMSYLQENVPSKQIVIILLNSDKYSWDYSQAKFHKNVSAKTLLGVSILKGYQLEKNDENITQDICSNISYTKNIIVNHKTGIHARPAALIQNIAKEFKQNITISLNDKTADAKSILDILNLGISYQDSIVIKVYGDNAEKIAENISSIIEQNSKEDNESSNNNIKKKKTNISLGENKLSGITVNEGVVIGKVKQLKLNIPEFGEEFTSVDNEINKFNNTTDKVIETLKQQVNQETNKDNKNIMQAHISLLSDSLWINSIINNIKLQNPVGKSIKLTLSEMSNKLNNNNNEVIKQRVNDITDIAIQLLNQLSPNTNNTNLEIKEPIVVIAEDILPSVFSKLDKSNILAIVTTKGSLTAHISIMARAYSIPMIINTEAKILEISDNQQIIVNASNSYININPTQDDIQKSNTLIKKIEINLNTVNKKSNEKSLTRDGTHIKIVANITSADEAKIAFDNGADGVGLLRSEILFMHKNSMPNDKEQLVDYQEIVDCLQGKSVVIRTLDIGTDKGLDYYPLEKEENPALGVRGIRVSLQNSDVLYNQLKAILSITPVESYKIMLPMISSVNEVIEVQKVISKIVTELNISTKVSLGVMIETPAAALIINQLNKLVDFYSIGTNDLSQYVLAMDRNSEKLTKYIDGLSPSVLRIMKIACNDANSKNKSVAVCGMLAENICAVPILLGLGVRELSVSPSNIGKIKDLVRKLDIENCKKISNECLELNSFKEVRCKMERFISVIS